MTRKKAEGKKATISTDFVNRLPVKRLVLSIIILVSISFLIYFSSLNHGFVRWDDDWFVYENPFVANFSFEQLPSLFTSFYKGQYSPVTALIMASEYKLGNGSASVFHWLSYFLHLVNAYLVFIIIRHLSRNDLVSIITAGLFLLHPLQVETVSWISAQKVVNFSFFFLLALYQYVLYAKSIKPTRSLVLFYLFFILSFLSKEQAVTLALTSFGIDYAVGRNFRNKKIYFEKIPVFLLALAMGLLTIYSTRSGEFFQESRNVHLIQQIAYSSYSLLLYFYQLAFPLHLSAFYPYPAELSESFPTYLYAAIIPVLLLAVLFFRNIKKNAVWVFGLAFFLANIVLVLQIMPLRDFIIADRYVYIPAIGLWYILAFYLAKLIQHSKYKMVGFILLISIISVYSIVSHKRTRVWESSLSLFNDAVLKYPESSIVYNNRGLAFADLNQFEAAAKDYKRSIELNPRSLFPYNNLGIVLTEQGKFEESLYYLNLALASDSSFAQAWFNRAETKAKMNDFEGSISDFSRFLDLRPQYLKAYVSRGISYFRIKEIGLALQDLNFAVEQNYGAEAYLNRGVVYLNLNRNKEAIDDFNKTLTIRPDFKHVYLNRGIAYLQINSKEAACKDLQKAYTLGFNQALPLLQQHCQQNN